MHKVMRILLVVMKMKLYAVNPKFYTFLKAHVNVIEAIADLDENAEMVMRINAYELAASASCFFATRVVLNEEDELCLSLDEKHWKIKSSAHCLLIDEPCVNPWLDFLKRHHQCWIFV